MNNDVADAWQWAGDLPYPADAANLALRFGVNFVMYSLTHEPRFGPNTWRIGM